MQQGDNLTIVGVDLCCDLGAWPGLFQHARGAHFFMLLEEFKSALQEIAEKGFDDSFPEFCARTFSSHSYPGKNAAKAKMHAFYLRLFLEEYLSGADSERDYMIVGKEALQEVLKSENPTGKLFCRVFIEKWCSLLAR